MSSSERRRWWALGALALSVLVVGLDLTVLNLALPTLGTDLHASTSDLQWFVDSYSLVLAAALLPAGLLGDRLGRKRLLVPALLLFGLASLACAYSHTTGELVAARAVLGLGAAVILPLSLAVIPVLFAPEERQKAIAVVMAAVFVGYPLGPILGGWLLDNFWWGSVFLINVPVIALALIAVAVLMPESRSEQRPRLDVIGVVISSVGLTTLVYGFIKAGEDGWSDATALATIAAGVVVLAGFYLWERRVTRRPGGQSLVQLSLFESAGFTWGTILATLVSFALFGILFAMPLYFRDVRGLDSLGAGLRLLPIIGGMVVGMIAGTRLQTPPKNPDGTPGTPPVGAKTLVTAGFTVMAAGLAVGAFTTVHSGTGFGATWFVVAGLGLGLAMPSAMNAALGALSAERSGAGSSVITAFRQVGATLGAAILPTVLNSAYQARLNLAGLPAAAASAVHSGISGGVQVAHALGSASLLSSVDGAFVHGLDAMMWCCAGIALGSALLALAFLPQRTGTPGGQPQAGEAAAGTGPAPGAGPAGEPVMTPDVAGTE